MDEVEGARSFAVDGDAYDSFMGRYSVPLADLFADAAGVTAGQTVLDVGCGPGALTGVLVDRLGAGAVRACDPSPSFVAACSTRFPGVDVRTGRAEALPFDDDSVDAALAQLVLHFVTDPGEAAAELRRVVRPGGAVGACVWDFAHGMEMLRHFWDAALAIEPDAPDEARVLRFGTQGETAELFASAGLVDVTESTLTVSSSYADFSELTAGFGAGIGPAGAYYVGLTDEQRSRLDGELHRGLGAPSGSFTLQGSALCTVGRVPS